MKYADYQKMAFYGLRNHYDRKGWNFLADKPEDVERVINGMYEFAPIYWDGDDGMEFRPTLYLHLLHAVAKAYKQEFKFEYQRTRNNVESWDSNPLFASFPSLSDDFEKIMFWDCVNSLDEKQAELLTEMFKGLKLTEIAVKMDVSYKVARNIKAAAFESFKENWDEQHASDLYIK